MCILVYNKWKYRLDMDRFTSYSCKRMYIVIFCYMIYTILIRTLLTINYVTFQKRLLLSDNMVNSQISSLGGSSSSIIEYPWC